MKTAAALFLVSALLPAQVNRNCILQSRLVRAGNIDHAGVWGYAEPGTGREFAIVGTQLGTWIVETTNPTAPVEKGFITAPSNNWREVCGYGHFIYSVSEGFGGVHIISLQNPDAPVLVRHFTVAGWNNTHAIAIDQGTGRLYCNGATGGMRVFDLTADPTNPTPIVTYTSSYVHECFVQHGFAYTANIYDGVFRILDVTNLPTFTLLSATVTPGAFTHNIWVNSTDTIALTTDEIAAGFMQVYDITNKRAPVARGRYQATGSGIHNVFLRDDKVAHISYYTIGYRAVDVTNPDNPLEIGAYDTTRAWGCYPFQPSRNVYVSDDNGGGLVVLRLACGVPEPYGPGTAGTGGAVPAIDWHGGYARVNNPGFRVEGSRMLGGTAALLLLGAGQTALPAAGITLLVDPALPMLIVPTATSGSGAGNGTAALTLGIPDDAAFGGASLFAQWVCVDPAGAQGLSASQGMKITVCQN